MEKNGKTVTLLLIGFAIVLALGVFAGTSLMQNQEVVHVQNIFSDINGDGQTDLILEADVILNVNSLDFQSSQPEQ